MPTVSFRTLGCKLNQAETAILEEQFVGKGYSVVPWNEPSDVSVLNTCTVTSRSDSKCRQAVHHILQFNPSTTLIVVGCYSQVAAEDIRRLPGVDYVFGTHDKFRLFDSFSRPGKRKSPLIVVSPSGSDPSDVSHFTGVFGEHTRAFLKIQSGCSRRCAYCIVPIARGPGRSLPLEGITRHAQSLVHQGYREIVLTGTHIGDYGKDMDGRSRLPDLLAALCAMEGIGRIRLSSLDPDDLNATLMQCMASDQKICRHVHLSLQSGSDAVLHDMNRKASAEEVARKVEMLSGLFGPLGLGADVITGFPGETDALFQDTVRFIESLPFTYLHVFPFSPRKGTAAASMPGQIPPQIRMRRAEILRNLGMQKKRLFHHRWIGRTLDVLMEAKNHEGWMSGLSSEYVRVEIPYDRQKINRFLKVRVESADETKARGKEV